MCPRWRHFGGAVVAKAKKPAAAKGKAKPKAGPKPATAARERDDCPRGECCLWRLGLLGEGRIQHELGPPYPCQMGDTQFGTGYLELKVRTGPCDEPHGLIPDGSKINAAIHTLRRED